NRQTEESLKVWTRLEQQFPDDNRVAEQIALWMAQDGRWTEALSRFQKLSEIEDDPDKQVGYQISAANMLIQLKRETEARTVLEKVLSSLDPESWRFRDVRARIETLYRSAGQLQELADYLETWLQSHPDDTDAMLRLAGIFSELRQPDDSERWLDQAIRKAPSSIAVREFAIRLLLAQNRVLDAIRQYEQLEQFDNGNLDHREAHGLLYLQRSDLQKSEQQNQAAKVWESLLQTDSKDPVLTSRVAGLMQRAGMIDRAEKRYRQAIELAPDQAQYREYLGDLLHREGKTQEAIEVWQGIAAPPRRTAESLIRLSEVLRRFGHLNEAVSAARSAIEISPSTDSSIFLAGLLAELAKSHADAGHTVESQTASDEALRELDRAAETAAENDLASLLSARVSVLETTGRLQVETEHLAESLRKQTVTDAKLWERLATFSEALGDYEQATSATLQQLKFDIESASALQRLTDLYERTGRLGDAIEAIGRLAKVQPGNRIELQRRIARLQSKLGRHDEAIAAGELLITLSPGDPDSYRFLADLAFAAGRSGIAVEALRKGVRVSPGDPTTLKALGKLLADEFQTAEAIECYWKALEASGESDGQSSLISTLSQLYLRCDRFDELIERLQRRGREQGLETEMAVSLAAAWKEAGEFQKAREQLEQTLEDSENSVSVLMELANIAALEHNRSAELNYRTRILRGSPRADDAIALIRLVAATSTSEETRAELQAWLRDKASDSDCRRVLNSLFDAEMNELAELCCDRVLRAAPQDWFALLKRGELLLRRGDTEGAYASFRELLALPLTTDSTSLTVRTFNNGMPPFVDSLHECFVDQSEMTEPESYGDACRYVAAILAGSSHSEDTLSTVTSQEFQDRIGIQPIMAFMRAKEKTTGLTDAERTTILKSLQGRNNAAAAALRLLMNAPSKTPNDSQAGHAEQRESVDDMLSVLEDARSGLEIVRPMVQGNAARMEQLRSVAAAAIEDSTPNAPVSEKRQTALLSAAVLLKDESLLIQTLETVAKQPPANISDRPVAILQSPGSPFLENARRNPRVVRSLVRILGSVRRQTGKPFSEGILAVPHQGATLVSSAESDADEGEQQLSFLLHALQVATLDDLETLQPRRLIDDCSAFEAEIIDAELARQQGNRTAMLMHMIEAAKVSPASIRLRLWIAKLAASDAASTEALALLSNISTTDPSVIVQIEQTRLNIARAAGETEIAKDAAARLAGLPLLVTQRLELVPALKALGLDAEAAALETRMEHGEESRQSMLAKRMQTLMAAGQTAMAGEVAWEMLRLASGGSLFSGYRQSDDEDDGGERLQALRQLGKLGRLHGLIQRYREMVRVSPDSMPLLEVLAELEEAADDFQSAAKTRDQIAVLQNKIPRGLSDQATELENKGDVKAACQIYLQICRETPAAFADEMETYYQAFERAGLRGEFLTAVLDQPAEHWEEHGRLLINVLSDIVNQGVDAKFAVEARDRLLSAAGTRRQTIASFLARGSIGNEADYLPALAAEFEHGETGTRLTAFSEFLTLLEYFKQPSSLVAARDQIASDQTNADRALSRLAVALVIAARLNEAQRVNELADAIEAMLRTTQADEAAELDGFDIVLRATEALKSSQELRPVRRKLLEAVYRTMPEDDGRVETSVAQLLEVYREINLLDEATKLTSVRLQTLLSKSSTSTNSVRHILQAAEQVQHSGFPIEAWQLLNSVTTSELEAFTSGLEADKATAFQSRYNAARRWSEQKMTGEPIARWLIQQLSNRGPEVDSMMDVDGDLLLELQESVADTGDVYPGSKELRLDSPVLRVLPKAIQTDPSLSETLAVAVKDLSVRRSTSVIQLSLGILVSDLIDLPETRDQLIEQLDSLLKSDRVSAADEGLTGPLSNSPMLSLRKSEAAALIVVTRWLATHHHLRTDMAVQWTHTALQRAARSRSRIVRLAIGREAELLSGFLGDEKTQSEVTSYYAQLRDTDPAKPEVEGSSASPKFDLRRAILELCSPN
ncbi:MAG: tetratricopeptide repeat protein, partial [Planctomycetaceae bacterium]|nr:tetratricopeptide repeat protein [Planctomycetaceae bacterium]